MKYEDFVDAISAAEGDTKKYYKTMEAFTCMCFDIRPEFKAVFEKATDIENFLDLIFEDKDSFKTTAAWACIAIHRVEDPVSLLEPTLYKEIEPFEDNVLILKRGIDDMYDLCIEMPTKQPITKMYVFEDGEWNREFGILKITLQGTYHFRGETLTGFHDVIYAGDAVVFEHWKMDSHGRRIKAQFIAPDGYEERL